jgi:hypothetical protein
VIKFRPAVAADYPALQEMHRLQNLGYPLPPLANPAVVVKLLAENDGKIEFAAFLRLTSEAYLLASPEGDPAERWEILKTGNAWLLRMGWDAGFSDINAVIPPKLAKSFGPRLIELGWSKEQWDKYQIWPGNKR